MKRTLKLLIVLLSIGLSTMTSCSKDDDDTIDVRDQAIGNYTGEMLVFSTTDLETATSVIKQDFSIEKANNSLSVNFIIDGEIALTASKVAKADNGITFDLDTQDYLDDGDIYSVKGINFIELDNVKYHGAYETSSKEIGVAFEITMEGENYIMVLGGTKK